MPAELNNPVVIEPSVVTKEKVVELIDIVGDITIKTNENIVEFHYALYQYKRDEEGNIQTTEDGKKIVSLIRVKKLSVGDNYYTDVFNEIINGEGLGYTIERKLLDWIFMFDEELSASGVEVDYVNTSLISETEI